jgi:hypothetical protein
VNTIIDIVEENSDAKEAGLSRDSHVLNGEGKSIYAKKFVKSHVKSCQVFLICASLLKTVNTRY